MIELEQLKRIVSLYVDENGIFTMAVDLEDVDYAREAALRAGLYPIEMERVDEEIRFKISVWEVEWVLREIIKALT